MEWPGRDGWEQAIFDPYEKVGEFHRLISSMHQRWEKAGNIGAGSYWSEPPRALKGVEYFENCLNACRNRLSERVN